MMMIMMMLEIDEMIRRISLHGQCISISVNFPTSSIHKKDATVRVKVHRVLLEVGCISRAAGSAEARDHS